MVGDLGLDFDRPAVEQERAVSAPAGRGEGGVDQRRRPGKDVGATHGAVRGDEGTQDDGAFDVLREGGWGIYGFAGGKQLPVHGGFGDSKWTVRWGLEVGGAC